MPDDEHRDQIVKVIFTEQFKGWGRGRDQRLRCPSTKPDETRAGAAWFALKLHFICMYKKGFFPYIPIS